MACSWATGTCKTVAKVVLFFYFYFFAVISKGTETLKNSVFLRSKRLLPVWSSVTQRPPRHGTDAGRWQNFYMSGLFFTSIRSHRPCLPASDRKPCIPGSKRHVTMLLRGFMRCHGAITTLPRGRNNVATGPWQRSRRHLKSGTCLVSTDTGRLFSLSHIGLLPFPCLCFMRPQPFAPSFAIVRKVHTAGHRKKVVKRGSLVREGTFHHLYLWWIPKD